MAKINATYSSGYYISPDVDFRKLEEQQRLEQKRKRGRDGDSASEGEVKRQTFAIPFDVNCLHCHRRVVRGSHVYANRRATADRYLGKIRIWELEIRCKFCQQLFYLRTDPETPKETGGYVCASDCERCAGDFLTLNQMNKAAKEQWEKDKEAAELNPLEALEKENEATRLLAERNRQIEEDVEANAAMDDADLLRSLRARRVALQGSSSESPTLSSFLRSDSSDYDDDNGRVTMEEELEYQRFEQEMTQRWQKQQQTQETEAWTSLGTSQRGNTGSGGTTLMEEASANAATLSAIAQRYATASSEKSSDSVGIQRHGDLGTSGERPLSHPTPAGRNAFVLDEDDSDDTDAKPCHASAPSEPRAPPTTTTAVAPSRPTLLRSAKKVSSLLARLDDNDDD